MKISLFNILFEEEDFVSLYNSRTGVYIFLKNINPDDVSFLENRGSFNKIDSLIGNLENKSKGIKKELINGGFILPDDIDELEILEIANRSSRFAINYLNFTILTTHACNFDCIYCYEKKYLPSMSEEVQDHLVNFVDSQRKNLEGLMVTWFGGEPLIAREVIQRLSVKLIDIALERKINYSADIITNGYLLTREVAQELRDLGVKSAQITLDGAEETHNKRRPLKGGKPSFKKIINNIHDCHDLLSIAVRINLDTSNLEEAERLIDYLADHEFQNKIQLSFAPVHNEGLGSRERMASRLNCGIGNNQCGDLLGIKNFSSIYIYLNEYAFRKGFPFTYYPLQKSNACIADLSNGYVVEPDGSLHKCWQTVTDPKESIGNVFSGTRFTKSYTKWLMFDPFKYDKCRECKVLPICMGWCPAKIMKDPSLESCNVIKFSIEQQLKLFHRSQKQQFKKIKQG